MYSVVIAFGVASVMLCLGMVIRAKVPFFRHMLMPTSVIGGLVGLILMNTLFAKVNFGGMTTTDFSNIVDVFFVMSFISIGLTGKKKNKKVANTKEKKKSGAVRGAMGMALIWCILYAMDYYCERNFELVDFDTSILMEGNDRENMRSQNQDYKAFSTEQIKFKDDAVYMIVY